MKTDIQIAQEAEMKHIKEVAVQAGISEDELEFYKSLKLYLIWYSSLGKYQIQSRFTQQRNLLSF